MPHRADGDGDEPLRSTLARSGFFAGLSAQLLDHLVDEMALVRVEGGDVLMAEGDPADGLYVVVHGRLQVRSRARGGDVVVDLGPGEMVGEMALVSDGPRTASVRATRDCLLARLSNDSFAHVCDRYPEVSMSVARVLARRVELMTGEPRPRPMARTIALLPVGSSAPSSRLATGLIIELARFGSAVLVDDVRVDEHLGAGSAASESGTAAADAVSAWLAELERRYRLVVYQAGSGPWTDRCLRQADRVLAVADARRGTPADASRLLESALAPRCPADMSQVDLLVVQRSDATRPRGTAPWLAGRAVRSCFQLRDGRAADLQRLARWLTGQAVGLVLGGGGPRGFAHLGVMRALEERGVPIDLIGGSSIGAVMGFPTALGWAPDEREQRVLEALEHRGLFGPTFPVISLSSSRRITALLRSEQLLGETDIEDFWLPYFCVSSNLTRAMVTVHERGRAWRAVRASISLPGLLPPVYDSGDLLVDGGVMNNLPADVMHDRVDGGPVIAVDLQPDVDLRVATPFAPTLSGWRALAGRLPGPHPKAPLPSFVGIMLRAKDVGSERARAEVLSSGVISLHLRPPSGNAGPTNFSNGRTLIEEAYRHACGQLSDEVVRSLLDSRVAHVQVASRTAAGGSTPPAPSP